MKRVTTYTALALFLGISVVAAENSSLMSSGGMWSQGNAARGLGSVPGRLCYLQYLTGNLDSGAGWTGTQITNGNWSIFGETAQGDRDISGGAYCINIPGAGLTTASWDQGRPEVNLGPAADRVCMLTAVGGKFMGRGESVYVRVGGDTWYLGGTSKQRGVFAAARCIVKPGISYGPERDWQQGMGRIEMSNKRNAACFLTAISGKFAGGGEQVFVDYANGRWTLGGTSGQQGISARGICALF